MKNRNGIEQNNSRAIEKMKQMKRGLARDRAVEKRHVCRMQSCRKQNDGNIIGAKFRNSNIHAACTFPRSVNVICCCGITIKQSNFEIMLKMHLPFERGSMGKRIRHTIKTNAVYIGAVHYSRLRRAVQAQRRTCSRS